jgi:peroxiredoxin Q/BCP
MAQLRQDHAEFVARDIEVLVVGPEDARAFAEYFRKESLPFIGPPDPRASVLKLYGQEINLFKLGRMPAQVLVDKAGIARFVNYGHDMTDIPTTQEMLALGDEINPRLLTPAHSAAGRQRLPTPERSGYVAGRTGSGTGRPASCTGAVRDRFSARSAIARIMLPKIVPWKGYSPYL